MIPSAVRQAKGDELFYGYMVDDQPIVTPDTFDAVGAIAGFETCGKRFIGLPDRALNIGRVSHSDEAAVPLQGSTRCP